MISCAPFFAGPIPIPQGYGGKAQRVPPPKNFSENRLTSDTASTVSRDVSCDLGDSRDPSNLHLIRLAAHQLSPKHPCRQANPRYCLNRRTRADGRATDNSRNPRDLCLIRRSTKSASQSGFQLVHRIQCKGYLTHMRRHIAAYQLIGLGPARPEIAAYRHQPAEFPPPGPVSTSQSPCPKAMNASTKSHLCWAGVSAIHFMRPSGSANTTRVAYA